MVPEVESLPYLLLDVRDDDAYQQCHIIGGEYFQESTPQAVLLRVKDQWQRLICSAPSFINMQKMVCSEGQNITVPLPFFLGK